MEILLLLVERRPELVTREAISEKIWGPGVFVDTDNSINGAIRKLRHALGDDADSPRFILTVTAKGYRFIAPVSGEEPPVEGALAPSVPETESAPKTSGTLLRRSLILLAAVVLLGTMGALLYGARSSVARHVGERLMLAVLPFENLTGDASQDYFSDGFTEEMITRLSATAPARLGVIARTSVMYYRQARKPLDDLARELRVQYVLEGSVRRESEHVRITAQLIRVADQSQIWARQYDREQTDVLRVQEEIAEEIGDQIELALGQSRSPSPRSASLTPRLYEAYEEYLKGLHALNLRTADGFRQAIVSFQRAIAANPDDGRSHAGLADAYALLGTYSYAARDDVIPKARDAALRALEIDPDLAEAHTSLALVNEFFDWDWQAAEDRFRRALALDPNYATAHHWYAEYLAFRGRFPEAQAEIEQARRLDPRSRIIEADCGAILYFSRDYEHAIEKFLAVRAQEPKFARAHLIVPAYIAQGRLDEAQADVHRWQATEDGPSASAFAAYVYARLGRTEEARVAMRRIEEDPGVGQDLLEQRTIAYLGMGRKDEALACLEQACRSRSTFVIALGVDPIYDPLRRDPRFEDLLRCVGLRPPATAPSGER